MNQPNATSKWTIPHPGTGQPVECATFEEAMDKYFEGYNIPFLIVDGKREEFQTAYDRVAASIRELAEKRGEKPLFG